MKYTYVCGENEDAMLLYCSEHVGESARFYSELHQRHMFGTVLWVQNRTVTVEVAQCE